MMILHYHIDDGLGNHGDVIVQAATREECDRLARAEFATYERHGLHFQLERARVTDFTGSPVIHSFAYDHEVNEIRLGS